MLETRPLFSGESGASPLASGGGRGAGVRVWCCLCIGGGIGGSASEAVKLADGCPGCGIAGEFIPDHEGFVTH